MPSSIAPRLIQAALLLCLACAGLDPATANDTLRRAADAGDAASVRQLIAEGADVNAHNDRGYTALINAASEGHRETVRLLLDAGADPDRQTIYGSTALSLASGHHPEVVRMLLAAGANVDKGKGLVQAAWNGQHEIVRMLIEAGADLNVQTQHECTPLYAAANNGHRKIVRALIDAGADVHVLCRHGITAMGATYDPRIIHALFMAGDDIRHLNERLRWDLTSSLPTLAAILLGIVALAWNRKHLKQASTDAQRTLKLANNRRMYRYYLADTGTFLLAYLGLVYFPWSLIPLAILAGLFIAGIFLMLTNESNKIALPERYSWHPSLLFAAGLLGMAATGFMWWLLHWLDW